MEKRKFQNILISTRQIGGLISKQQKTGLTTNLDTVASILPGRFVESYCFNKPHIESYFTFISVPLIAVH